MSIYNIDGLAFRIRFNIIECYVKQSFTSFRRCPGDMGSDDAIFSCQQWAGGMGYHPEPL